MEPKRCNGNTLISTHFRGIHYFVFNDWFFKETSTLNELERMAVLDVHNKLRSLVATGQISGQPGAKNMQQIVHKNPNSAIKFIRFCYKIGLGWGTGDYCTKVGRAMSI
jgi:hypothetical protein